MGDGASTLPAQAAAIVRQRAPDAAPRVALVLGSGLGPLADRVEDATAISYADLPGFPEPGVEGHAGRLVLGTLGGTQVACLQGRAHAYEGRGYDVMATAVRTMRAIGCEAIYLTCAAGSLRLEVGAGRLMTITDHINLQGGNPLVGPNDAEIGPRFPPLADAYDPALAARQAAVAAELGIDLASGVYCAWLGPSFETPAEVRMIKGLGADAVGMSTGARVHPGPALRPEGHRHRGNHQSGRRAERRPGRPRPDLERRRRRRRRSGTADHPLAGDRRRQPLSRLSRGLGRCLQSGEQRVIEHHAEDLGHHMGPDHRGNRSSHPPLSGPSCSLRASA